MVEGDVIVLEEGICSLLYFVDTGECVDLCATSQSAISAAVNASQHTRLNRSGARCGGRLLREQPVLLLGALIPLALQTKDKMVEVGTCDWVQSSFRCLDVGIMLLTCVAACNTCIDMLEPSIRGCNASFE